MSRGSTWNSLGPGEQKKVVFILPSDMLAFTGMDYRKVIEPGDIKVMVGSSSEDIRLTSSFRLVGPTRYLGEDRQLFSKVEVIPV